jgi:anti-anti-sigma regulatory factor
MKQPASPLVVAIVAGKDATSERQIDRAVESGAARILVDLEDATVVRTPALNALLRARQRLLCRNGAIAVVVPLRMRRLFDLLRFDRRFLLARDRLEALQQLGLARPRGVASTERRAA